MALVATVGFQCLRVLFIFVGHLAFMQRVVQKANAVFAESLGGTSSQTPTSTMESLVNAIRKKKEQVHVKMDKSALKVVFCGVRFVRFMFGIVFARVRS